MPQLSNSILLDLAQDQLLAEVDPEKYNTTFLNRMKRQNTAYESYVKNVYQEYPRSNLSTLVNRKSRLQAIYDKTASTRISLKIQELQTKIDNLDYCVEDTTEWTARQEFLAHAANFQWPDANEIALQQQEETELLALLGQ